MFSLAAAATSGRPITGAETYAIPGRLQRRTSSLAKATEIVADIDDRQRRLKPIYKTAVEKHLTQCLVVRNMVKATSVANASPGVSAT